MSQVACLPKILPFALLVCASTAMAAGPSFDCKAKGLGEVETLICKDAAFSALDQDIAAAYKQAHAKAAPDTLKTLAAEQRGWIKGRNDCWKDNNKRNCITNEYLRRLAELQARYALIEPKRTVTYQCEKKPAHTLVVKYFTTKKASVVVEQGDNSFLLLVDNKAGTHYTGRNEKLSVAGAKIEFTPAYEAPAISCVEAKAR